MTVVEQVTTTTSSVPLHTPFVTALRRTETTDTVVVTITDSDGRTGWGEAPQVWQVTGESLASATACIETMLAPAVAGHRLDDRDDLAAAAALVQRSVARNFGAKAAVDAALHDLVAQAEGTSVAALLSARPDGIREVLTTDVTLSAGAADALADTARARVADGFRTLKMKVGTDASTDVQRVASVRDAVGPDVAIRLDANQGWTREEAVQVIRALEVADLGVEFVEQPVVADDVEGLAWVRERVGLPVMADESCYGPFDLERIIRLGAADLVNVKLAKCGSLAVGRDMLRRAHEVGLRTIVGSMMESHVGVGAAAALVAAEPTTEVSDLDAAWWSVRSPVIGGIAYSGNEIRVPLTGGLGISGFVDHG
ncbi:MULTISPECIES: dipeptide epimerase [unclassified Terrabacter]|uniref:dipeptide epimerase n=1 Tax=unclassified Terrabacter TaxID=2630222 RepID=UPI0006FB7823|nr:MULTISPECIES: dipeptide epimerase [unclassified Terrabacter]KRB45182.1 muconate cycloisomerase [Terrabacter sp. Root181]KRF40870.1 muconate cycloisomerase [Terrabacter sp. Soil810]